MTEIIAIVSGILVPIILAGMGGLLRQVLSLQHQTSNLQTKVAVLEAGAISQTTLAATVRETLSSEIRALAAELRNVMHDGIEMHARDCPARDGTRVSGRQKGA